MKKLALFGIAILMAMALVISCDDTAATKTYKVSFETDGGTEIAPVTVAEGAKVKAPAEPAKEGFKFVEWQLDEKPYDFNSAVTKDITLKAKWLEIKHVANLSDINGANFGFNDKFEGKAEAIVIAPTDAYYIVDTWQDLWFRGDVTVKNVEFAKGVSFFAQGTAERTIVVENCIIRWCDQKKDLLPKYDADKNFRFENGGNGLCLSIDGGKDIAGFVNVEVRNCTLIGDNNPTAARKDSFSTKTDYESWKIKPETFSNFKGRGNGVGLGTSSGSGNAFKSAVIEGCSFEGLRNAAVQLYTFNCPITIENCDFKSWGINSEDAEKITTFAIRGDVPKESHANASLTITDCTFDPAKPEEAKCKIDNLEPTIN